MKKITIVIILISSINLYPSKITEIEEEKKDFLKEISKDKIMSVFSFTQTEKQDILNKITDKLVFTIDNNPLIILPVLDSSKDLGINYGIMPIMAFRNKKRGEEVSSVIAPSINKNKYLGYTYAYRHYIFPTEKSLFVLRAILSDNIQKEFFAHYYNPEIFATKARINLEYRHFENPKSSFYGYGPNSHKYNRANYTFYLNGGEMSITLLIREYFYFDWTPSYYKNKISKGVVDNIFPTKYPYEYQEYKNYKNFFTNKFSFLFDTTDHPFLPRVGRYITFSMLFSSKKYGSDYDYSTYTLELKNYYNYKFSNKSITAVRFMIQWQTGEKIPFYAMPTVGESTGLRMAGDGRFVDRAKMLFNIEQRFTVVKAPVMKFITELEITPFLDVASVANSLSKISTSNFKYGPGIALRIVLRPQIVGTADFAFGSEGLNTIVKVNYPF